MSYSLANFALSKSDCYTVVGLVGSIRGRMGDLIAELLKLADLARLEFHGPADELEKLKGPAADLKPEWYALECGRE